MPLKYFVRRPSKKLPYTLDVWNPFLFNELIYVLHGDVASPLSRACAIPPRFFLVRAVRMQETTMYAR
jgi:hypothetical protein